MACPGDSDSENEDGVLEKIASTFDHLFSEDEEGASDSPPSDSEGIADLDVHSDSGETETADNEDVFDDAAPVFSSPRRHHHHEHRASKCYLSIYIYKAKSSLTYWLIAVTANAESIWGKRSLLYGERQLAAGENTNAEDHFERLAISDTFIFKPLLQFSTGNAV